MTTYELLSSDAPEGLRQQASQAWASILDAANSAETGALLSLIGDTSFARQLGATLACSLFAREIIRRRPWLLLALHTGGALSAPLRRGELETALVDELATEPDAGAALRRFRQRQMLRIVWRDLNRTATAQETMRDVSWLADACIGQGLEVARRSLEGRFGVPVGKESGRTQSLVVLAMGKLGAHELNLSSDIDLVFAYPESGATNGGKRSVSNEEYFTRLGRELIALLDPVTAEGFVFRVDMRLRPYGDSGPLVQSFAGLENYFEEQGRDWERYAMIKARPVTGEAEDHAVLERCIQDFVFRRYVDYSAIESLRSMKQMIIAEVRRRGLQDNVKLGSGGIREIEFVAQCFQLIRGGRERALRQRELINVLHECATQSHLPSDSVKELQAAYLFLRNTEHAIQAWEDRQTQELPEDPEARAALAFSMGFYDWHTFLAALDRHRQRAAGHFADLIAEADEVDVPETGLSLWSADCDTEALRELGYGNAEILAGQIAELFKSRRVQTLQSEGRERLDRFMPLLLEACARCDAPDLALERSLPLVVSVARRSAYLLLLIENPPALADLVSLCGASPWIAEQLVSRPALLDELLDRASLYEVPERDALRDELRQQLSRISQDDLEGHMDALRYFKASQVLRVAASERAGRLPLMKVSDKLSFIAEACLEQVVALAWSQLSDRHGEPSQEDGEPTFAVIAYGKLGGIELSYASDLDLVFLYDAPPGEYTTGERSIDNATFFTRLGQRMIHILETRMALGQLYEVDMRLRPSGASGLLVSSFAAFESYQKKDAWTWEHQALVRARTVCGDRSLMNRIEALRQEILRAERDEGDLAKEVVSMRARMRASLAPRGSEIFDLKQSPGGIVDIEFMVQYAVLAWAARYPSLADWSDNVRILDTLAETGLLSGEQCSLLSETYLALRSASHELALQQEKARVASDRFANDAARISALWGSLFGAIEASLTDEDLTLDKHGPGL
ncbi:MAG: bifunctional [glutamate--ammonia ligase]-adenylyl-L-tyrosine phosphorylase/[glutamate--ammonia-ligase] adenylyltransferase [Pseudomonadota bacterium]